jgi:hypothetical protein
MCKTELNCSVLLFTAIALCLGSPSFSTTMAERKQVLQMLGDFAERACPTPPLSGNTRSGEFSGTLNEDLPTLIKNLLKEGATLSGKSQSEDFVKETGRKIAETKSDDDNCHLKVTTLLFDRLIGVDQKEGSIDSVVITEATMAQRGPRPGYSADQYYVRGIVQIQYFGKGPYKTNNFTACVTGGDTAARSNYCDHTSRFSLSKGRRFYGFTVYMPGGEEWRRGIQQVPTMVCIIDASKFSYFSVPPAVRYSMIEPVCDTKIVSF